MRKKFLIIVLIVVLCFIAFICFRFISSKNDLSTGTSNEMTSYTNSGYSIEIKTSEPGNPVNGSVQSAFFESEIGSIEYHCYFVEKKVSEDFENYEDFDKVELDGKTLKYTSKEDGLLLLYDYDGNSYFMIALEAPAQFDEDGNLTGEKISLDNSIFAEKGFENSIEFDIKKSETK